MASKVWEVMNDLEMTTSKIISVREIIDAALVSIQNNQNCKAETLMSAAYEFLGYYLDEFDAKFKDAWNETVVPVKYNEWNQDIPDGHWQEGSKWERVDSNLIINKDGNLYPKDKTKKWILPIEEDFVGGEYFITFPDDLLELANLNEGDEVEWIDRGDGSWELRKVIEK
jgi:hypothetical protein